MAASKSQSTRAGAIDRARAYVKSGAFETVLARRVAVRTESQLLPKSMPQLMDYLDGEMRPAFEAMGFSCRIFENPLANQGPVLLATRIEDKSRPTVLGYGHGDVIRGLDYDVNIEVRVDRASALPAGKPSPLSIDRGRRASIA